MYVDQMETVQCDFMVQLTPQWRVFLQSIELSPHRLSKIVCFNICLAAICLNVSQFVMNIFIWPVVMER